MVKDGFSCKRRDKRTFYPFRVMCIIHTNGEHIGCDTIKIQWDTGCVWESFPRGFWPNANGV